MKKQRSFEIIRVGFYLSKYGEMSDKKTSLPPKRLNVRNWNDAYELFYTMLNDGRTKANFVSSLQKARSNFDSILQLSGRIGRIDEITKKPSKLAKNFRIVYVDLIEKKEIEVWDLIKGYIDDDI